MEFYWVPPAPCGGGQNPLRNPAAKTCRILAGFSWAHAGVPKESYRALRRPVELQWGPTRILRAPSDMPRRPAECFWAPWRPPEEYCGTPKVIWRKKRENTRKSAKKREKRDKSAAIGPPRAAEGLARPPSVGSAGFFWIPMRFKKRPAALRLSSGSALESCGIPQGSVGAFWRRRKSFGGPLIFGRILVETP